MAAVASEVVRMATRQFSEPVGRGNELMCDWARYRRGGNHTRSPVASGSWSDRLDVAVDAEPAWVCLIDLMLGKVIRANPVYKQIVQRFWLDNKAMWDVAEKVQRTEGFVWLALHAICDLAEAAVPE